MKAVIYARYSSENQREESIEGQIRECTTFAEKNGITVLKHYIDRAYSAKTDSRPEFQRMIRDCKEKLFDMILVWKLDRFSRNRYDSIIYKHTLKKNGVRLVSVNEPISESAEGVLLESVLEGFAEYFSLDLAEKVNRGLADRLQKEAVKKDWIEDLVIKHTMEIINDDKVIEAIVAMLMDLQERENIDLPLYEQQLRDVERNIENLLNAIQQGILTKSTKARMEELEAAKEELEIRIANERMQSPN